MKLDPKSTAWLSLVTLGFQKGILDFVTEKVFPRQAPVLTVDDFVAEQGAD